MNAVSIGPLVLAADRFAVILGMFVFILITGLLARRVDERFLPWSWWVLLGSIAAARLGHVLIHWRIFAQDPIRAFAFWEGGFFWPAGLAAVLLCLLVGLRTARQRLWALLPLTAALVVWNTAWRISGTAPSISLPAIALETLAGGDHELDGTPGIPKVINLWATWCPPCRREMPMMAEIAEVSADFDFVFANQGESRAAIENYLANAEIALDLVLLDRFGDLARHYGAPGLPATLFIDAEGMLQHAHLGEISRENLLSRLSGLRTKSN